MTVRSNATRIEVVCCTLLWTLLTSCGSGPEATSPIHYENLILISVDTLRADRLGAYGYDRDTSPTMDSLADQGIRFETAIADSSWTLPSHMTMFTGLWPSTHGMTHPAQRLSESVPTLAETLQNNGFRTFGYTSGGFVAGDFGFARGFEIYTDEPETFQKTANRGMESIRGLDESERYFLFLHTFDVHCPYTPPESYAESFRTVSQEHQIETEGLCGNPDYNSMDLNAEQVRFLSDLYDASIRAFDDDLANFLAFLRDEGRLDDTLIVLTSDHGEEFKEHGNIGHGDGLYIEALQVPWIMAAPGLTPQIIRGPVGLVDMMPTFLDLLSVDAPPMQGRSSFDRVVGQSPDSLPRPVFSELDGRRQFRSIVNESDHLVVNLGESKVELYDYEQDPKESHDLNAAAPAESAALQATLKNHLRALVGTRAQNPKSEIDPELQEELKALGYIEE